MSEWSFYASWHVISIHLMNQKIFYTSVFFRYKTRRWNLTNTFFKWFFFNRANDSLSPPPCVWTIFKSPAVVKKQPKRRRNSANSYTVKNTPWLYTPDIQLYFSRTGKGAHEPKHAHEMNKDLIDKARKKKTIHQIILFDLSYPVDLYVNSNSQVK